MNSMTFAALARWSDDASEVIVAMYEDPTLYAANTMRHAVLMVHNPSMTHSASYSVVVVSYPNREVISQSDVRCRMNGTWMGMRQARTQFNALTKGRVK